MKSKAGQASQSPRPTAGRSLRTIVCSIALLTAGCAAQPTASAPATPGGNASGTTRLEVGDGRSFESAIVIAATDESSGVKAEYAWIGQHIPGGKPAGQSLLPHGRKICDLIHVKLPDETIRDVYFDITAFFGKL